MTIDKCIVDFEEEESLSFVNLANVVTLSAESSREPSLPGDPLFEFRPSIQAPNPSSPADLLFSNGLLLPRSPLLETEGIARPRCLRESAGQRGGSQKLPMSASKRVSFQFKQAGGKSPPSIAGRPIRQLRNESPVEPPTAKEAEGRRGVLGFLMSACMECHALEPSSHVVHMRSTQACSNNYNPKSSFIYRDNYKIIKTIP